MHHTDRVPRVMRVMMVTDARDRSPNGSNSDVRGAHSTRSVAFMVGWYVQVYADSPARLTLYFQDLPGALMPESK